MMSKRRSGKRVTCSILLPSILLPDWHPKQLDPHQPSHPDPREVRPCRLEGLNVKKIVTPTPLALDATVQAVHVHVTKKLDAAEGNGVCSRFSMALLGPPPGFSPRFLKKSLPVVVRPV